MKTLFETTENRWIITEMTSDGHLKLQLWCPKTQQFIEGVEMDEDETDSFISHLADIKIKYEQYKRSQKSWIDKLKEIWQ